MIKRTTKKQMIWLLLVALAIFASACGGQTAEVAIPEQAAAIDVTTLGPEVDVETVAAIKDQSGVLLLDVREQWEYDEGHIPGVVLIPMGEIPARLAEIPVDQEVIVTCRSGNRSSQVTDFLRQQGFDNVHNMQGGILAWQEVGLPVER